MQVTAVRFHHHISRVAFALADIHFSLSIECKASKLGVTSSYVVSIGKVVHTVLLEKHAPMNLHFALIGR